MNALRIIMFIFYYPSIILIYYYLLHNFLIFFKLFKSFKSNPCATRVNYILLSCYVMMLLLKIMKSLKMIKYNLISTKTLFTLPIFFDILFIHYLYIVYKHYFKINKLFIIVYMNSFFVLFNLNNRKKISLDISG